MTGDIHFCNKQTVEIVGKRKYNGMVTVHAGKGGDKSYGLLKRSAERGSEMVRCQLAQTTELPADIQLLLAKDHSETVRYNLALNPTILPEVQQLLARNGGIKEGGFLVFNPNLDRGVALQLWLGNRVTRALIEKMRPEWDEEFKRAATMVMKENNCQFVMLAKHNEEEGWYDWMKENWFSQILLCVENI